MAVRKPIFIDIPYSCSARIVNSTAAVEFVNPASDEYARLENMTVINNHAAAVTVELIKQDEGGIDHVVWAKELDSGQYVDVIADRIVEPIKQFLICEGNQTYYVRAQTAVAGEIAWETSGGLYTVIGT